MRGSGPLPTPAPRAGAASGAPPFEKDIADYGTGSDSSSDSEASTDAEVEEAAEEKEEAASSQTRRRAVELVQPRTRRRSRSAAVMRRPDEATASGVVDLTRHMSARKLHALSEADKDKLRQVVRTHDLQKHWMHFKEIDFLFKRPENVQVPRTPQTRTDVQHVQYDCKTDAHTVSEPARHVFAAGPILSQTHCGFALLVYAAPKRLRVFRRFPSSPLPGGLLYVRHAVPVDCAKDNERTCYQAN